MSVVFISLDKTVVGVSGELMIVGYHCRLLANCSISIRFLFCARCFIYKSSRLLYIICHDLIYINDGRHQPRFLKSVFL